MVTSDPINSTEVIVSAEVGMTAVAIVDLLASHLGVLGGAGLMIDIAVMVTLPVVGMTWHKLVAAITGNGLNVSSSEAGLPPKDTSP